MYLVTASYLASAALVLYVEFRGPETPAIELVLLLIGVDLRAELKQKLRLPASRVVEDCAGFVQHSKRRIKRVDRIVI